MTELLPKSIGRSVRATATESHGSNGRRKSREQATTLVTEGSERLRLERTHVRRLLLPSAGVLSLESTAADGRSHCFTSTTPTRNQLQRNAIT